MKKLLAFIITTIAAAPVFAQLKLPALFADNMVLQQNTNAPVWGWTKPGQRVVITGSWSSNPVSAVADKNGRWMVKLPTPKAGGPFTVQIKADKIKLLNNVLIGEVWICSGQSNMEMPVSGWATDTIKNSAQEIMNANYPSIRLYTVDKEMSYAPCTEHKGAWSICSPAMAGSFSATAYFFGRELYQKLKVPIGLIHTSWGGTIAEAWTSEASLRMMGDFDKELDIIDSISSNITKVRRQDSIDSSNWQSALLTKSNQYKEIVNAKDWKVMQLPSAWEYSGLPNMDGIVWFKRSIHIPDNWAGKELKLNLGPIDDRDITYFNGTAIDSTTDGFAWATERHYTIPKQLVKAGENIIAVKVTDDGGDGGMYGTASQMILYLATEDVTSAMPLSGEWQYKVAAIKNKPRISSWPNQPSVLYNAMIAPLIPFAIKGAIWYQGESNVGRAAQYTRLFPLMINDWRKQWQQDVFPFYFVQIAPFKYGGNQSAAAQLRDAQRKTLELVANTGMAVTLDISDTSTIHPPNKQDVGKRLAKWALNKTYSSDSVTCSGPLYKHFEVKGDKVVVSFTHADGGLRAADNTLKGFELQGDDNIWKPALAVIEKEKVIVSNRTISKPVGVRYAFYNTSIASLFNGKGLPASSFTTETLQ